MAVYEISNLTVEKGTYFEATFNLFNSDNSVSILTGLTTTYAAIRKFSGSTVYEEFTKVINVQTGTIILSLTEQQTSNLTSGRNYFDVVMVLNNKPIKVIKGTALVQESMSV
jgi:hypothetical protein